jgi:CxxC-x17-CxxC domain-containing protein
MMEAMGGRSEATGGGASGDMSGKYPAVCSACEKAITLPFEPTPGRPVYCKSCLAKVKAGEIQPVRVPRAASSERSVAVADQGVSALASLGIEFEAPPQGPERPRAPREPQQNRPAQPRQQMPRRDRPITPRVPDANMTEVPATAAKPAVSLSTLKPREANPKHKTPKPEVNIEELRNAIAESLKQSQSPKEEDYDIDPKER